jgi:hypothetical protein
MSSLSPLYRHRFTGSAIASAVAKLHAISATSAPPQRSRKLVFRGSGSWAVEWPQSGSRRTLPRFQDGHSRAKSCRQLQGRSQTPLVAA